MMGPDATPKKAGMFGAGKPDWGQALIAGLNGYLAARGNPVGMAGLHQMMAARQQAAEQAQYGQRREDEFQDWVRKQAYQSANPSPVNNDTVADYGFIESILGKDEAANFLRNKANPPQLMNIPGVGIVQIPRMGGQGMPSAPVGKLTPIDEGGPAPQGPGGFPGSGQY
jgi:hypothetical protein